MDLDFHRLSISYVIGAGVLLQFYNVLFLNIRITESPTSEDGSHANALASGFLALATGMLFMVEVDSKWTWPVPVLRKSKRASAQRPLTSSAKSAIYKPRVHITKADLLASI